MVVLHRMNVKKRKPVDTALGSPRFRHLRRGSSTSQIRRQKTNGCCRQSECQCPHAADGRWQRFARNFRCSSSSDKGATQVGWHWKRSSIPVFGHASGISEDSEPIEAPQSRQGLVNCRKLEISGTRGNLVFLRSKIDDSRLESVQLPHHSACAPA